jgi:hypothetical protein
VAAGATSLLDPLVPPLSDIERKALLTERIPARMKELFVCAQVAKFEQTHRYSQSAVLTFGTDVQYTFDSSRWISYPVLDGGLVILRGLTEFMGINYASGNQDLREKVGQRSWRDDVLIPDLSTSSHSLSFVTIDQASRGNLWTVRSSGSPWKSRTKA